MDELHKFDIEPELEEDLVQKINELYIMSRNKCLVLNEVKNKDANGKVTKTGKYTLLDKDKIGYVPLTDKLVRLHLRGIQSLGVFSGKMKSKFLCFDLDIEDKSKLKWTYYLLVETLNNLGISSEYIQVSTSGNKGYHLLIFVENSTYLKHMITLFNSVMNEIKSNLPSEVKFKTYSQNEHYGEFEYGKIEMRCTYTQGVKLELGINFFNQNKKTNNCLFLDKNTLTPIKDDRYILSITPMKEDLFLEIMSEINDVDLVEVISEDSDLIKGEITEPPSHKVNKDEDQTLEHIVNLIQNGLYLDGTRHNSCLKIAKYFRYMGLNQEEATDKLQEWMKWQDKKCYKTPLDEALSECERLVGIVYDKEYSLVGHIENLQIYKSEIKEIINLENRYDKLLLYTMLIHSKRYALKSGVFYMTFKQMHEMCGMSSKGAGESLKRLEEKGYLEVVSRNVKQQWNLHKANKYRILLDVDYDEVVLEIDNSSNNIKTNESFYQSVSSTYSNKELKSLLPDRQYRDVVKYQKLNVS